MTMKFDNVAEEYEMSQAKIAEKMFLHKNTVMNIEKRAIENFRKELEKRGITFKDLLEK